MTDLVGYLQTKLADCSCPYSYSMGRTDLGRVDLKRWEPGCPRHATEADVEAENDWQVRWLYAQPSPLPDPEPSRRKRWWQR